MTTRPKKKTGKVAKARAAVRKTAKASSRSNGAKVTSAAALRNDEITVLDREPWIRLADARELSKWSKDDEIRYNQGNRQKEKYLFFRRTFDFLHENETRGDYYEFGCHRCRTFRMALTEARRHNLDEMKFWAFDSFEGLPAPTTETSVSKWTSGALTTSESAFKDMVREHGIYTDRVSTVKGFYSDSLTPELRERTLKNEAKIALVTVDCDLYESAVPVFNFIEPLLQEGSVIYMDDLFVGNKGNPNLGVAKAFLEFQQRSSWNFGRHLDISWWGRSYVAYSGDKPDGII